jgi:hypothetical protein
MAARTSLLSLRRRGTHHGRLRPTAPRLLTADELIERWDADRPIVLRRALADTRAPWSGAIRASVAMFERLRRGASFQDEVASRLAGHDVYRPAGASVDLEDPREIEKAWADARRGPRRVASELYAKLSWIAHDERDASLRIRFSFGSESLRDWQRETRRAPWSDGYARAVFPECAAIEENGDLVDLVRFLTGSVVRFSERIVYSNAPGGGAILHHDDEAWQLGVLYSQLAGETAWLALSKKELAAHLAAHVRAGGSRLPARTPARALRALDRVGDPAVERVLNETPAFTRRLAEAGALFHLKAGDSILLPTHGPDATCWHSVFALGKRPSLAHSYGIFATRRARPSG